MKVFWAGAMYTLQIHAKGASDCAKGSICFLYATAFRTLSRSALNVYL